MAELCRLAKGVMGLMMTTTWFAEQSVSWLPTHQLVDFYHLYGVQGLSFGQALHTWPQIDLLVASYDLQGATVGLF